MKSTFRKFAFVLPLSLGLMMVWFMLTRSRVAAPTRLDVPVSMVVNSVPRAEKVEMNSAEFRRWIVDFQEVEAGSKHELLAGGMELAKKRGENMARLIQEDPERALQESLRWHEYAALPVEMRALVERPFSAVGAYHFYPVCRAPLGAPSHLASVSLADNTFDAYTFGVRAGVMSKNSLPLQGITLNNLAAMDQYALRELEPAEVATVRAAFPLAHDDAQTSFLTGERIIGEPIIALGAGKIYYFASREELSEFNQALAKLDDLPGPTAGSDALYTYQPIPAEGGAAGFDLSGAQLQEQAHASAWTEQPKRVFMIRVDFSDRSGASHTQQATANALNGSISDQIRAMSYGKTWIIGGASANTYRMPQTSAYYVNAAGAGSSFNDELLRDARNTFRTSRSGGDAAINIGPQSLSQTGATAGLGDYDIVGVLFSSMSMRAGFVYGGLAGGADLWMQGTIGNAIFTHELGHNYGIGHSSFWNTTDGSVTGAGLNDEYGDDYDIMGGGEVPKGHFHAQAKSRLNWLAPTEWNDATALGSRTHRMYRVDDQFTVGTPRGVRITRSAVSGQQEYLWLGYRPLYADVPHLERGAYMVWQRPNQTRSWLVDTTPATDGDIADAPIALGQTYADAASGAFITPLTTGGAGAEAYLDVRVNFGPFPGNGAPVSGAIQGPSTIAARSVGAYNVASASDPNSDTLAYSWSMGDGNILPNVAAIAPRWIVGGNYNLNVTVSDMKGGIATSTRAITVTDPLDTWTVGSVATTDDLNRVFYANGRYLTANYWGATYMSWDGLNWSSVGAPPDIDQQHFAFGAGVFVAAGLREANNNQGQLTWSADGRRWIKANFPAGIPGLRSVVFANGVFLALGNGGAVLTSVDGKTWSLSTVPGAPDFRHLAWTGGAWVAMAMHPVNARPEVTWTSADGILWTERLPLDFDVYSLFTNAGVCYALGWYGGVNVSTDHGQTWQSAALPKGTRWTTRSIAAAPDGTLICSARAMDEANQPGALLVSIDGLRWSRASGNTAVGNVEGMIFAGGRFLAVDDDGVTRRSDSFYPGNVAPTGSFATLPTSASARNVVYFAANGSDTNGDALTYVWDFGSQIPTQTGREVAPIFDFGGNYQLVLRIIDERGGVTNVSTSVVVADPARSFTNRPVGLTGDFEAVASGGGRVVAVGSQFSGSFSGLRAWSANGVTWNTGNLGSNRHLYGLVHDGNRFVGAGTRYDFTAPAGYRGWIATSLDGETWTERYYSATWLRTIAFGGGIYLAAGDGGSLIRSTDGQTWSSVAIPGVDSSMKFAGLAWNGSVFLLTGYMGGNGSAKVFSSTDGNSWMDLSVGAGLANWQDFRKIAWLHDRFIASGWYSKLRVSTDGGATFSTTRSDSEEVPASAYGSGMYFAAGENLSASNADVDHYSRNGVDWVAFPAPTTNDRNAAIFFNNTFITVGVSASIWQSDPLTSSSGFVAWQTEQFSNGGLASLTTGDPDADGLSNALEYALGLSPHVADRSSVIAQRSGSRMLLDFQLPEPARSDITYRIEGQSNLTPGSWSLLARKNGTAAWTWQTTGTSRITVGSLSSGRVPVQIGQPDDQISQGRYFMRLIVEMP